VLLEERGGVADGCAGRSNRRSRSSFTWREERPSMKKTWLDSARDSELDDAFARSRAYALLVNPASFFISHNKRIVELAQRHSMPVMYPFPDNVVEGGLIGYGPSRFDVAHQKGIYTAESSKAKGPPTCRSCSQPRWN
jgi:hypothetical protein